MAIRVRNIDLVKKLIDAEVSVSVRNNDGYTPLSWAANCARFLNMNTFNYEYNTEALELLIMPNKSLAKLKEAGAKPEKTDLMIACSNRDPTTAVSRIGPTLAAGSIDFQDRNGLSALWTAAAQDLLSAFCFMN
jgi:ankyrin repeat protein